MRLRHAVISVACGSLTLVANVHAAGELERVQQLQREGRIEAALAEADRHLANEPRDARMRFVQASLLAETGRVAEAIDVLQGLTQAFPSLAEPHNNLAALYASRGEYDKSRESLEQALRLDPGYATAHENLGDVYAALAARAYQSALRLDPSRTGIEAKLARARQLLAPLPLPSSAASAAQ